MSHERATATDAPLEEARHAATALAENVERVVHGKHDEILVVLVALLCGGHVLLEDVPGTAKTVLARAISASVGGATFARVQCTPDLQPTDVTGLSVYNQRDREFEFRPGPIFANILLVDEINRATPKTQSALLEAMAERQVTVDGVTRSLPTPFLLIATENPIEYEGTFPLPEAQIDRFFVRVSLGYPTLDDEVRIVQEQHDGHPLSALAPVTDAAQLEAARRALKAIYIDPLLQRWLVTLVRATRDLVELRLGASVRGSLALEQASRAWALLHGREFVVAEDVERLLDSVLAHRVVRAAAYGDVDEDDAVVWARVRERALARAPRPSPEWLDPDAGSRRAR